VARARAAWSRSRPARRFQCPWRFRHAAYDDIDLYGAPDASRDFPLSGMHSAPLNIHGPVGHPHDQYVAPHPQYGVTTTHSGGTVPQNPVAP